MFFFMRRTLKIIENLPAQLIRRATNQSTQCDIIISKRKLSCFRNAYSKTQQQLTQNTHTLYTVKNDIPTKTPQKITEPLPNTFKKRRLFHSTMLASFMPALNTRDNSTSSPKKPRRYTDNRTPFKLQNGFYNRFTTNL